MDFLDDPAEMTPERGLAEVAAILAAGWRRPYGERTRTKPKIPRNCDFGRSRRVLPGRSQGHSGQRAEPLLHTPPAEGSMQLIRPARMVKRGCQGCRMNSIDGPMAGSKRESMEHRNRDVNRLGLASGVEP